MTQTENTIEERRKFCIDRAMSLLSSAYPTHPPPAGNVVNTARIFENYIGEQYKEKDNNADNG